MKKKLHNEDNFKVNDAKNFITIKKLFTTSMFKIKQK